MNRRQILQTLSCLPILSVPSLVNALPSSTSFDVLLHVSPIRLLDMFVLVERWDLDVESVVVSRNALSLLSNQLEVPLTRHLGSEPSLNYWPAVIGSGGDHWPEDRIYIQARERLRGDEIHVERFQFTWSTNVNGLRLIPHTRKRTSSDLVQGQYLGPNDLSLLITKYGAPIDVAEINYTLIDVTTGREVQVGSSLREPVRHATGHYYASLLVPQDANIGEHRIRWTFRRTDGWPIHQMAQKFNVVSGT